MMNKNREEAVWKRVMAVSAEAPECQPETRPEQKPECKSECKPKPKPDCELTPCQVMDLLEHELQDVCTYQTLAARVRKNARSCLLQLAQEERQHYRKLEAIYYLMTGQRPCPDRPKPPCVACLNEELRRRYEIEVRGAMMYHQLAEQAGSFACTFHCLGNDEERHSQVILNLLQQCL